MHFVTSVRITIELAQQVALLLEQLGPRGLNRVSRQKRQREELRGARLTLSGRTNTTLFITASRKHLRPAGVHGQSNQVMFSRTTCLLTQLRDCLNCNFEQSFP